MNTDLAGKMKKVTSKREVKIRIKKKNTAKANR